MAWSWQYKVVFLNSNVRASPLQVSSVNTLSFCPFLLTAPSHCHLPLLVLCLTIWCFTNTSLLSQCDALHCYVCLCNDWFSSFAHLQCMVFLLCWSSQWVVISLHDMVLLFCRSLQWIVLLFSRSSQCMVILLCRSSMCMVLLLSTSLQTEVLRVKEDVES